MGKIENAVNMAIAIANDNTHGYSQANRWGNPDYDCSALVIDVWTKCGVDVKSHGATYTGNMTQAFLQSGFRKVNPVTESLQAGDVLINVKNHAAMYIGNGKLVQATIAENGTIYGSPGDQTGTEIGIFPYYDYPWDWVLRYDGDNENAPVIDNYYISYSDADCVKTDMPQINRGDYGSAVAALQAALKYHGFYRGNIDGVWGYETDTAFLDFQKKHGLEIDGICGCLSWNELMFWR